MKRSANFVELRCLVPGELADWLDAEQKRREMASRTAVIVRFLRDAQRRAANTARVQKCKARARIRRAEPQPSNAPRE